MRVSKDHNFTLILISIRFFLLLPSKPSTTEIYLDQWSFLSDESICEFGRKITPGQNLHLKMYTLVRELVRNYRFEEFYLLIEQVHAWIEL